MAQSNITFQRDIRPILSDHCFACHGPDANHRQADLRLDSREGALAVIDLDDPFASELLRRVRSHGDGAMPPAKFNKPLSPEQLKSLTLWIEAGARWEEHWSFAPIKRPMLPNAENLQKGSIRNPIDLFVQQKIQQKGWSQAEEADRCTLIRRVCLDLTGIPPSPQEVEQFLADTSADAYESLVKRLLSSPAFGERMAWDWLDAARYADTNGYQGDNERTMWPWRDWVVRAFNDNLPFDQFTIWQLAGDLIPNATEDQQLATAFCRNHMINGEGGRIPEENRVDYVMDMTESAGTVWLGLTLNCCRCHDHKFDPIQQKEYYQLFAFFNQTPVDGSGGNPQTPPVISMPSKEQMSRLEHIQTEIKHLQEQLQNRPPQLPAESEAEQSRIDQAIKALVDQRKNLETSIPKVMVMADQPTPRQTYILTRGLYNQPAAPVTADVPQTLPSLPSEGKRDRLALANWLVAHEHPLTARVIVNRLWQQIFGIGLVKTVEDFGSQGEIPIHLELLDFLAAEFRESGWDTKRLMEMIVTSHTYRQSSSLRDLPSAVEDPENRWLARGPRFRMPSWMIRDQALAVSGLINLSMGGPSVNGYQPDGVWEEASFGNKKYQRDSGEALYRRSLYIYWRRIIGPTMFFDTAARQVCTVKTVRTNTPLQALAVLNDVTFVEAARALAVFALSSQTADDPTRLTLLFQRVLARKPSPEESAILLQGLERSRRQFRASPPLASQLLSVGDLIVGSEMNPIEVASWTAVGLALLNLDEVLTKE